MAREFASERAEEGVGRLRFVRQQHVPAESPTVAVVAPADTAHSRATPELKTCRTSPLMILSWYLPRV
jgi:hypothetical protein